MFFGAVILFRHAMDHTYPEVLDTQTQSHSSHGLIRNTFCSRLPITGRRLRRFFLFVTRQTVGKCPQLNLELT